MGVTTIIKIKNLLAKGEKIYLIVNKEMNHLG